MTTIDLLVVIEYYKDMDKKFFSTAEIAKLLGISRQAVLKKIKTKEIKAQKIGRNFVVHKESLGAILKSELTVSDREKIEKAVKKTIDEYGETLKLLGSV
jgi:excisionase family DNA binding protein